MISRRAGDLPTRVVRVAFSSSATWWRRLLMAHHTCGRGPIPTETLRARRSSPHRANAEKPGRSPAPAAVSTCPPERRPLSPGDIGAGRPRPKAEAGTEPSRPSGLGGPRSARPVDEDPTLSAGEAVELTPAGEAGRTRRQRFTSRMPPPLRHPSWRRVRINDAGLAEGRRVESVCAPRESRRRRPSGPGRA